MRSSASLVRGTLVPLMLAVLIPGCGRSSAPTVPRSDDASPGARLESTAASMAARSQNGAFFYPLALGSRWSYATTGTVVLTPEGGSPGPPTVYHTTSEALMTCVESLFERSYQVERNVIYDGSQTSTSWVLYRQDESGLYEADRATATAPSCEGAAAAAIHAPVPDAAASARARALSGVPAGQRAAWAAALDRLRAKQEALAAALLMPGAAGGLEPGEITRLRYPLHPGQSWAIRTTPFLMTSRVEAVEALDLPAGRFTAYRIRIESPDLFGPHDRVLTWYGRDGFLKLEAHLEGTETDESGQVIGTAQTSFEQELTAVDLGGE